METTKLLCRALSVCLLLLAFAVNDQCHSSCSLPLLPEQSVEPELLIFVSFNMPEQSLKLWEKEASLINGKLLFRGFLENSLEKTTTKALSLFGEDMKAEMAIDPEKFQKFKIEVVPAVIIAQPESENKTAYLTPPFDVVYGDTSLEEALKRIVKGGTLEGQKAAQRFLKLYRGKCE